MISKAGLWEERAKAIKQKYYKLNHDISPKLARDKQAKFGCKGGNRFWYDYKKDCSVDMQSSMINKIAVTSANIIDSKGLKHIAPKQGAIYADKGCCDKNTKTAARNNLHLLVVKKNNMKDKNNDLDKF